MADNQIDETGTYTGAERELLRGALDNLHLSVREAARRMGMSDTRLRHILNGYQPAGRGQRIATVAPAETLARAADVLGLIPESLEEVGREDAAGELRRIWLAAKHRPDAVVVDSDVLSAIQKWVTDPSGLVPPVEMLGFYEDSALLDELERRLYSLRVSGEGVEMPFDLEREHRLSAVPDKVPHLVAADEQEQSISGEQEESETP